VDKVTIRARVRGLIESGTLPCDEPEKTWAGNGAGERCLACGDPIGRQEIEFEVEFAGRTILLHGPCHRIWLEECEPLRQT
jgi:hypothetical protein